MNTIEMLRTLIAFDTTSRNPNAPFIDFVQNYLNDYGIASLRVDHEVGSKINLYATIGPDIEGGVVLSGHTDVVPVDGQPWSSDPFDLVERDGFLYGRGSCDMKGYIASVLAAVPEFVQLDLKVPIHIALSCDEEVGCIGVRPLIDYLNEHLPKPAAVLVGEPTSMQVVDAHKGAASFTTTIKGHAAHASCSHLGVNAIMAAGELIGELNRSAREMRERGDNSGRFTPACTTIEIGLIEGGIASNIIPAHCEFDWQTRLLPDADAAEVPDRLDAFSAALLPELRERAADADIVTERRNYVPGLRPEPGSAAESLALWCAQANGTEAVSYGTEAGLFQEIGIPAVICGPGSIDQAHKPDEYVAVSQLDSCDEYLRRVAQRCIRSSG